MAKPTVSAAEFLERAQTDRDLYFRSAVRIRPKDAKVLVALEMREAQRRLMDTVDSERAAGRPPRIIVLKARQIGFSTVTGAEFFRQCHLFPFQQALITAHKAESAEYLFGNMQRIYDNLPKPIQPKRKYATKRLIHFTDNDSRLQVEVAGESRGFTAQLVHLSELGFVEDAGTLLTAIMQTVPDTVESLVVIESTANGIGNEFHNLWVKAKANKNEWVAIFVPWFEEPTYRRRTRRTVEDLNDEERHRVDAYGLDMEQIEWWSWTLENKCFGDLDKMTQEYPDNDKDAFLASGRPVFERKKLQSYVEVVEQREAEGVVAPTFHIRHNELLPKEPILEADRKGPLRVYFPREDRKRYILAADLSEGDPGSDPTPSVVLDQHTLDVCAVWYGRVPPEVKAWHDYALCMMYGGPRSVKWVWEANNHGILYGHVVTQRILYPNIHYRRTSEDSVSGKTTDKPGFWTAAGNREHLFNLVRSYVRVGRGRMYDPDMLREWQTLYYDDKNRVDHPDGEYSDCSVALGMALAVHSGGFDIPLEPLPIEQMDRGAQMYLDSIAAASMGGGHRDQPSFEGMTMDEVMRYVETKHRRETSRLKNGLSGST